MIRSNNITKALLIFLFLLLTDPVFAVKYHRRTDNGTYLYKCQGFCGSVRVNQLSKGVYRVISIPFSGEVKANSAKSAARYACREGGSELESIVKSGKDRNGPQC